ncbi:MAG: glyoxalase family protein [Gammaproteobacteria bacterium]|nr:MAG: glyoxalase family protein [Gammaproteobacteria bacterium]
MNKTGKINYIEIPTTDLELSKTFFADVFAWSFVDYGAEYTVINNAGLQGGFYQSDQTATTDNGSVLVVLYSDNLRQTLESVESAGGKIIKDIFSFPGGCRFHFSDPCGNEFAVWSESAN